MSDKPVDDEMRAFLRHLFGDRDTIPRDIVPGAGLTVEDLDRQNANAASPVMGSPPAELVEDVDGQPIGVEVPTPVLSFTTTIVSPPELEKLGITREAAQERWPHLTFTNKEGRTA